MRFSIIASTLHGVPIITFAPRCTLCIWFLKLNHQHTSAVFAPNSPRVSSNASSSVCKANSLVGARTNTWGAASFKLIAFKIGKRNAAVLPLHVWDSPTMWCPSTKCLKVSSWIGVGVVYPFFANASTIDGLSHRSANVGHATAATSIHSACTLSGRMSRDSFVFVVFALTGLVTVSGVSWETVSVNNSSFVVLVIKK